MAGDSRKSGSNPSDDPSGKQLADRLRALDERLDRKVASKPSAGDGRPANPGMASALRLSSEFISAVLVGAAIGWGIDRFFGLAPWGMILFLLLGFCAGVLNVLRAANRMAPSPLERGRDLPESDRDEED